MRLAWLLMVSSATTTAVVYGTAESATFRHPHATTRSSSTSRTSSTSTSTRTSSSTSCSSSPVKTLLSVARYADEPAVKQQHVLRHLPFLPLLGSRLVPTITKPRQYQPWGIHYHPGGLQDHVASRGPSSLQGMLRVVTSVRGGSGKKPQPSRRVGRSGRRRREGRRGGGRGGGRGGRGGGRGGNGASDYGDDDGDSEGGSLWLGYCCAFDLGNESTSERLLPQPTVSVFNW